MRGGQPVVVVTRQEPADRARASAAATSRKRGARLVTAPAWSSRCEATWCSPSRDVGGGRGAACRRAARHAAGADRDASEPLDDSGSPGWPTGGAFACRQGSRGSERRRPPGDLFVPSCAPHPLFRREGDDLHSRCPVAVHERRWAQRLCTVAPRGRAVVRVPPGTQTGQRFRVREGAWPSTRAGRRAISWSKCGSCCRQVLDERSKERLREFGPHHHEDIRADGTQRTRKDTE